MVAAGNSGTDELQYPAAYPEAIAVAATNAGGVLTDFSSYGATDVATIEPTAPLLDNTPYRIVVRGVQWDGGTLAPYTYAAWIEDRGGKVSPVATTQLLGMKTGISTTSTLINYGGTITLRGSTLRIDNKPYAGLPTNLHVRPKNSSKFTLLAALKTSSTGTVSFTDKPLVSSVFMMTFPGNPDLMGTRTPDITVQVAPSISGRQCGARSRTGSGSRVTPIMRRRSPRTRSSPLAERRVVQTPVASSGPARFTVRSAGSHRPSRGRRACGPGTSHRQGLPGDPSW